MTEVGSLRLSRRISQIQPSPTMAVMAEAMRLKAEGVDVVDFSAGQPDFPTPEHIKLSGEKAIADNFTRYTANPGTPSCAKRWRIATARITGSTSIARTSLLLAAASTLF